MFFVQAFGAFRNLTIFIWLTYGRPISRCAWINDWSSPLLRIALLTSSEVHDERDRWCKHVNIHARIESSYKARLCSTLCSGSTWGGTPQMQSPHRMEIQSVNAISPCLGFTGRSESQSTLAVQNCDDCHKLWDARGHDQWFGRKWRWHFFHQPSHCCGNFGYSFV